MLTTQLDYAWLSFVSCIVSLALPKELHGFYEFLTFIHDYNHCASAGLIRLSAVPEESAIIT